MLTIQVVHLKRSNSGNIPNLAITMRQGDKEEQVAQPWGAKGKLKKSKKLISEEKQAWENVAEELFECQKLVVFEDEEGFKNELR
ncbi:hypothetical protein DEO72_LG2g3723 [Vigna unguiculata]|uniref:Uncharacterized protein n=1 Tax=Vigna unguiculata TaxID=3917 RepID=A0A4D6L4G5_VIGUN|nr:hypothetical protein DEO72_LG2g3723 [Vigna unguiculata]